MLTIGINLITLLILLHQRVHCKYCPIRPKKNRQGVYALAKIFI
jgi:hypothetical protein